MAGPHSITVLMPVYNGENFLREAIESILNQTFKDFEFLIINDGSTDNSEAIILSYSDPRIRYVKNGQNQRLIATLNKGIELANGKYIARMDADDKCVENRLQLQYDYMESHPEVAICGSWFEIIGTGNVVKYAADHNSIMLKMLYQCHFCHPSVILRREVLEQFERKFDPQFLHAEDYDFFVRIGERFKLANLQLPLLHYRQHQQSVSVANPGTQSGNSLVIKKNIYAKLGLQASEDEINLFQRISQHEYTPDKEFLESAKQLLEKMVAANEQSGFFDKAFFRKALGEMWFHICYNLTGGGIAGPNTFFSSALNEAYTLTPVQKIKFHLKKIMK